MILLKQSNKNSTKRFQITHRFMHRHLQNYPQISLWKRKNGKNMAGSVSIAHSKFNRKVELKKINYTLKFKSIYYIINYSNFTTKIKEFTLIKNIYNQVDVLPSLSVFYPGFKLYPNNYLSSVSSIKNLIGQALPLFWIPINMPISFLFNKLNNKSTYIKSSGSIGIKKRLNRKDKLISVLLPSGLIKIFSSNTLTFFSTTQNLEKNKIIEGGWGYFPSNKKKITVRGVAKNPVDHPNGGRTKSKQPELSPWGWIAKHNK